MSNRITRKAHSDTFQFISDFVNVCLTVVMLIALLGLFALTTIIV